MGAWMHTAQDIENFLVYVLSQPNGRFKINAIIQMAKNALWIFHLFYIRVK